jgi:hypothetical protein
MIIIIALQLSVTAEECYYAKMVACDEAEERYVEDLYHAFLILLDKKELVEGRFSVPARFAIKYNNDYIFERAFYITPNILQGFSICIPSDCVTMGDGMLSLSSAVVLGAREARQGIQILTVCKRPNPMPASMSACSRHKGTCPCG